MYNPTTAQYQAIVNEKNIGTKRAMAIEFVQAIRGTSESKLKLTREINTIVDNGRLDRLVTNLFLRGEQLHVLK